jgi:outer membrane protein assembly factor BamB
MNRDFSIAVLGCAALLAFQPLQATDWPHWRGPDYDDVSKETGLLKEWPSNGPKRLWLFEKAGQGYSGFSVVQGKLFTMGARDGSENLFVLDANSGKELWSAKIGPVLSNNWGDGPRGTPTVDGDHVYALSGQGILACASTKDGKIAWQKSMISLGGVLQDWGYTESPVVDGNQVVCTPGGEKGAIAAFDKKSGNLLWQSSEFKDTAQYSSIVVATINGEKQYVQLTMHHVVGIAPKDGKVLWQLDFPGKVAVIPTPIVHDNCVYVTAGYGVGCKMARIEPGNKPSVIYENKVIKNHHGGVVLVGENLYGHSDGGGWTCQNFKTGAEVWSDKSFNKGAVGCADGMLYCLEEGTGNVALAEASPAGWKEHGRFKLDPQTKIRNPQGRIWTHPVISNGKLYLRDQDLIYCYDVKK